VTRVLNAVASGSEPFINRPLNLRFRGDWGQANMTRICGWLSQEIGDRSPQDSKLSIWCGRGGLDQIAALADDEADIAVITPAAIAALARDGSSVLGTPAHGELRALGTLGHDDRLVIAVDASLPVHTASDLLHVADSLVIATSPNDGVNVIGLIAHLGLELAGASVPALVSRGARMLEWERPFPALHAFESGEANVVIQEAVMTPSWQRIASRRPVRYIPWGDQVLAGLSRLGWPAGELPVGYLPGQDQPIRTIDFSDFQVICREDLPEDVAYLAAWCMVMTRVALEVQYRSFPRDRTPLTYPIDPKALRDTSIPLHPGALRAYEDLAEQAPLTEGLMWK
jgi:hypothetical protein